ncbi:MAG TPA: ThiF family adenylyltransferase [Candidatus Alistipes merdavium]|nr:ThiF family adenylyltransferase [Candidatus Alistipes merdavium]
MQEKERYEWGEGVYTLLSWFKMEKVKNARILVAGAGALGNEVIKNLALFGVGHIFVVDFDRIEISNLTRSVLFREEDAYSHAFKSEVAARRAMEINPQIKVTPLVGNLYSDVGLGLYRSADVIIGCLDSRIARYQLNRLSMRAGRTWIDGSIENLTGVVRVYSPGISCYECGLSREEFNHIMLRTGCADVVRMQSSAGRVATTPISASIIGAIQVQEAMKIIHLDDGSDPFKTLQGKIFRYEGLTNSVNIYRHASWKNTCPAHEQWSDIVKAPGLSATMTVREVLSRLKALLGSRHVEINMRNNRFIDKIISDNPEKEFSVRIPESDLDRFISQNPELRRLSYKTLFHKCFFENIDDSFPYGDFTLRQVGIPLYDVIQVSTDTAMAYVELSADAAIFN